MTERSGRRVRAGLVYLTASFLVVGLWATLKPSSFYDGFPGGGRQWVAGDGAYNAHLVADAGVGFLAVGLILLLAAVWMDIRVIQAAPRRWWCTTVSTCCSTSATATKRWSRWTPG